MIFDNRPDTFESEKERNLYYKIFAGYILNELIPGYPNRLNNLCKVINNPEERGKSAPTSKLILHPAHTHVSFDNHLYLFSELKTDRGEFADILIHDKSNRTIVCIEAKLHSDWSYDKDILQNQDRHNLLKSVLPQTQFYSVLLISRYRWNQVKKKESDKDSNYKRFRDGSECGSIVILWENLRDVIGNESVRLFLDSQLDRLNRGLLYRIDTDWFIQTSR